VDSCLPRDARRPNRYAARGIGPHTGASRTAAAFLASELLDARRYCYLCDFLLEHSRNT
jgi:hypothetical protein